MRVLEHPLYNGSDLDAVQGYLIQLAELQGVPLVAVPTGDAPTVSLAYLPEPLDWPEIHLTLMLVNWRIQAVDAPLSNAAHWCYAGIGLDTFLFAVHRLRAWGGDPHGEPTGYVKAHDRRATAAWMYRRRPGQLLTSEDFDIDKARRASAA